MNQKEQIENLFPLEVQVTQEMIDTANLWNPMDCIGAKALKEVLKEYLESNDQISWGTFHGYIWLKEANRVCIDSEVNMIKVTSPQKVIFTLQKSNKR